MIQKYLCFCVVFVLASSSHGIFSKNQKVKLMHDFIKQLEEAIHKLDGDVTRFGPSHYLNTNATATAERRANFLNELVLPGRSGSYAMSNSFYMYGKLISTAMSVAFVPIVQNVPGIPGVIPVAPYPNLPSRPTSTLAVEAPDDDYQEETMTTTEAPPERKKINHNLFYNPYFPQYFPYYVPAYNLFPVRNLGDPKGVPNDRYGPQSKFGK